MRQLLMFSYSQKLQNLREDLDAGASDFVFEALGDLSTVSPATNASRGGQVGLHLTQGPWHSVRGTGWPTDSSLPSNGVPCPVDWGDGQGVSPCLCAVRRMQASLVLRIGGCAPLAGASAVARVGARTG
jgi:hypothetical protein